MDEHTYLIHYGVKGMKWGKHRFRYEDEASTSSTGNQNRAGSTGRKVRYSLANPSVKRGKQVITDGPVGRAVKKKQTTSKPKGDRPPKQALQKFKPSIHQKSLSNTNWKAFNNVVEKETAKAVLKNVKFDWKKYWNSTWAGKQSPYASDDEVVNMLMGDLIYNLSGENPNKSTHSELEEYFYSEYDLPKEVTRAMIKEATRVIGRHENERKKKLKENNHEAL